MKSACVAGCVVWALLLGCSQPPPPPPPPPPKAVEPTPEMIANEIRPGLVPFQNGVNSGVGFNWPEKDSFLTNLKNARAKHQATENGKMALAQISHEIDNLIGGAEEQGRWRLVLLGIEASDALDPGNTKYQRLKERGQLQINKPKVKIKGFFVDQSRENEIYVWLEVTDAVSQKTEIVKVREGEEFHGLKLHKIIGTQQGVTLEYLKSPGDVFDVLKDPK